MEEKEKEESTEERERELVERVQREDSKPFYGEEERETERNGR